MAIFDVIVNTDDLVVLGPPEVIDVGVDFGPQGQRGATFYAGSGDPNVESVAENVFGDSIVPAEGDIYINTSSGAEYGWLYIYNPKVVGDQWDEVLRLQPPMYNRNLEETFASGTATMTVPIADIVPTGSSIAGSDSFIVNITPIAADPVVVTVVSKSIVSTDLQISLKAIKYASSTWSDLSETIDLGVIITVV